ncbi:MAG: 2-C-methyl-D-erythritol 4-phosphate cytidylyltransferase, partial [Candidatus Omnitrophica bacterium]|nr:2-C-methyl-D-erythritol 4-phosphate cytidylyltransferase [Candidatus Omnitrophota bacterium]
AGKGERLNSNLPKSFIELNGKTLFLYSIEKFYKFIDKIFLALPENYIQKGKEIIGNKFPNIIIVKGGEKRHQSIFNCLKLINEDGIVLVHDVARPFVSENLIRKVIVKTEKYGACIPVLKSTDTLKIVENNFVKKTIDRKKIFSAQTPQGFKVSLLKESYLKCMKKCIIGTDDSFFLEKIGYNKIYCIEGERTNIKITYPEDLIFAKFILKKWERE